MLVAAQLRFSPSAADLTHLLRQDDMTFLAPQAQIQLDGLLEDWACGPIKAQTPFYPFNKEGVGPPLPGASAGAQGSHCCGDELTMFDDRDNNKWNALDQSAAISFACKTAGLLPLSFYHGQLNLIAGALRGPYRILHRRQGHR